MPAGRNLRESTIGNYTKRLSYLNSEDFTAPFCRPILPEEIPIPDVPTDHRGAAVSRLIHDGAFAATGDRV